LKIKCTFDGKLPNSVVATEYDDGSLFIQSTELAEQDKLLLIGDDTIGDSSSTDQQQHEQPITNNNDDEEGNDEHLSQGSSKIDTSTTDITVVEEDQPHPSTNKLEDSALMQSALGESFFGGTVVKTKPDTDDKSDGDTSEQVATNQHQQVDIDTSNLESIPDVKPDADSAETHTTTTSSEELEQDTNAQDDDQGSELADKLADTEEELAAQALLLQDLRKQSSQAQSYLTRSEKTCKELESSLTKLADEHKSLEDKFKLVNKQLEKTNKEYKEFVAKQKSIKPPPTTDSSKPAVVEEKTIKAPNKYLFVSLVLYVVFYLFGKYY